MREHLSQQAAKQLRGQRIQSNRQALIDGGLVNRQQQRGPRNSPLSLSLSHTLGGQVKVMVGTLVGLVRL